jgi:heat shock protein HtpX
MQSTLGLSTYRWNNNLKSVFLLFLFPFLLLGLLGLFSYVIAWRYLDARGYVSEDLIKQLGLHIGVGATPSTFAASVVGGYWPIVIGIACIWVSIGFIFNERMIHAMTGATPIDRKSAPNLYNTLENLCISRGLKMPRLYLIGSDKMNAYASGIDERSYCITVTRGLLENLNHDEIEAVLGHELTHIINRDVRLLIITIVFVGMISYISQMLWRIIFRNIGRERDRGVSILMLIAAIIMVIGYVFALLLRFAISRKREYLADAGSVVLTKNPEALITALEKISANSEVLHIPPEARQMLIENPPTGLKLFDTHPPIKDRILILRELSGLPR